MDDKKHKWETPYLWLNDKSKEWDKDQLREALLGIALYTDPDSLQDRFQEEMEEDGYFRPLLLMCGKCGRRDQSQENGNCVCGADFWIEETDVLEDMSEELAREVLDNFTKLREDFDAHIKERGEKKSKARLTSHCDNCERDLPDSALAFIWPNIPDITKRMEPGEFVPYGECGQCGALTHPIKEE